MNPKCKYKKLNKWNEKEKGNKTLIYCHSSGFKCTYMGLGMEAQAAAFIIPLTSLSAVDVEINLYFLLANACFEMDLNCP